MSFSAYETEQLIEYLPEALFLEDFEGNILDVNTKACQLLGYSKEELLDQDVDEIIPEDKPVFTPDQIDEATKSGKPIETVNLRKDGTKIPVELRGRIVEVEGRKRLLVSVRDITEREVSRRELKKSKERYQNYFETLGDALFITKIGGEDHGRILEVNDRATEQTGYDKEELIGMNIEEDLDVDPPPMGYKEADDRLARGEMVNFTEKKVSKDGTEYWTEVVVTPIDYEGQKASLSINRDITERKELEGKLKAEKNLFDTIMNHSPDLVYFKDEKHRFERANKWYTALLGIEEEDMIGKTTKDLWPEEAEEIMEDERRALNGEPVIGREREVTLPTGEKRWYSINKLPRRDADGNVVGFLGMDRDITKRKKLESSLEEEKGKLRSLHETVDRLQRQETEKDLTQTAVEAAEEMLDFELCTIALVEGDKLVPRANSTNLDPGDTRTFEIGEGIAGKTVQEGETIWVDDLRNHPKAKPTSENFRALISVPIGKVGSLQVISEEVASFDQSDVELVEILVGHLDQEIQRVRLQKELRQQAIRDPLTDLYNRRYFNETLKKEVEKAERHSRPVAFLMIDINRFKEINDRYSHQTGDEVLKEVAKLLEDNVRSADTVVRYGGDEFLIMMPETDGEAGYVVSRIKDELKKWNQEHDMLDFPLTVAVGLAHWSPDQDSDVEDALEEADKKMYEDKEG
ncbi:PAS domain S-box protein [Candidatus Bipolaricaulota bacterium]|nr:PAS domain S-box protein [Candidatus Bipolaricaulota bacterium]